MTVKLSSIKMEVPFLRTNKESKFAKWWPLFKAYAIQKEFADVIKKTKAASLPEKEVIRAADGTIVELTKEQKDAVTQNKMGIAAFTIAFSKNENEDCQAFVSDSKTEDWPSGQCHEVVQELLDEFAADNELGQVQQVAELQEISMETYDNPKTLFSQITSIEQRYKGRATPLTERDKRAQILIKAPPMYQTIISAERQAEQKIHGREPTLKELRTAMYNHYKSMQLNRSRSKRRELHLYNGDDDDSSDDDGSYSEKRYKKKKGQSKKKNNVRKQKGNEYKRCYGCGETGHIKRDCPNLPKCGYCGKRGHQEKDCWKKHPDKRPNKGRNKKQGTNDMAAIVVEDELTFTAVDANGTRDWTPWSASNACSNEVNSVAESSKVINTQTAVASTDYESRPRWPVRGSNAKRRTRKRHNKRRSNSPGYSRKVRSHAGPRPYQRINMDGWPKAPARTYRKTLRTNEYGIRNDEIMSWTLRVVLDTGGPRVGGRDEYTCAYNKPYGTWERNSLGHAQDCVEEQLIRDWHKAEGRIRADTRAVEIIKDKLKTWRTRKQREMVLAGVDLETSLASADGNNLLYTPYIWIAHTGASCHVTNSDEGARPSKWANTRLKSFRDSLDASGNKMQTKAVLDIKGAIHTKDGDPINIVLKDCQYGGSKFNLCSLTKLTESGWLMQGNGKGIYLTKGGRKIAFDIPIKTQEGKLWAARIDRRSIGNGSNELTLATPTKMSVNLAHQYCGHNGVRETKRTAKHLKWELTRTPFRRCEACAVAKARQANLLDGESNPPKKIGELYYVDGMRLKKPKRPVSTTVYFPTNNCLVMAVEHLTGAIFTGWYETKSGFVEDLCVYFNKERENGRTIRRIWCDNAGENRLLQRKANGASWKFNVNFEYTAKTPQRNSRVETKLFHLGNKTRAALEGANVPDQYRYVLFTLFHRWCCQTEMLTMVTVEGVTKTRYEHLHEQLPKWIEHMQIAGMAGVVKTHTQTTSKVNARGKTCLFVCYAEDHAKDCYVMYDPKTRKTLHSRDVLWLNRMYFPARDRPGAKVAMEGLSVASGHQPEVSFEEASQGTESSKDTDSHSTDDVSEDDESEQMIVFEEEDSSEPLFDTQEDSEDEDSEQSGYKTRSGRTVRAPIQHDGTRRGELVALHIEDRFVHETSLLGMEEISTLHNTHIDEAMSEEEYILFSLTKEETVYSSVEHAFGYVSKKGEYMLVAAALETQQGELFLVGATGHNYGNTAELNVMNYQQAMKSVDKSEWEKAIKVEHDKMVKYNVFKVVRPEEVPSGTKLFDSTWAMKKKPDGTFRARNAIRGFMQVDGEHYDSNDKSSPVATEVGIRVCFVLAIVGAWYQHLVDVEGAFLNGVFQKPDKHKMFMKVPEAYKKWYPPWAVFLLLKTQYGTVQAALQYYRECCKALAFLKFQRNKAEPCVFFKWKNDKLLIFTLWVDDCCISGPKDLVLEAVKEFTGLWDCKDLGELNEYVGCKVERTKEWIKLTQPVKVQRFIDEFNCNGNNGPSHRAPSTPAEPGSVLEFNKNTESAINQSRQTKYRSGVGILLHMMRWSRPDVLNAVRELSSHMAVAGKACYKALHRVMNYIVATKEKGYIFRPVKPACWNGERQTRKFKIRGKCDSEYAKHSSRRSVNAGITYLEGAIVKQFSKMMPIMALSTTEAELYSAVLTAQDMMFVYHIIKNLGLEVKLPMRLYCDNKGAVALANNWSVGGRTRHMDVKQNFLRELKENGLMEVRWRPGTSMTPDVHTKNLPRALFDKYREELVN